MKIPTSVQPWLKRLPLMMGVVMVALWLHSLIMLGMAQPDSRAITEAHISIPTHSSWRDALLARIAITDTAIQEMRGVVQWQVGARIARAPLAVVADGQMHTVVIPLGIHPDWTDGIQNLQIVFPGQSELAIEREETIVVQRSLFALDALLGLALIPLAETLPTFRALVLLTAFLFGLVLGLIILPLNKKTAQGAAVALIATLCAAVSLVVIVEQVRLLPPLWSRFFTADEAALALAVPHYAESALVNQLLAEAASPLPAGEVLVRDPNPAASYLKVRAFYLLYPRRVSFAPPRPGPLVADTAAVIQPATGRPPAAGWQRAAGPLAGLEVWRAPSGEPPAPLPIAEYSRYPWGILALLPVLLVGFGVGTALGWRGLRRWASAFTIGVGLSAWWMTMLSLTGMPWSLATVGAPLALLGSTLALLASHSRSQKTETTVPTLSTPGVGIHPAAALALAAVIALFVFLTALAGLTPLSDQDSWTTWGFNSRALFAEGSVLRFLQRHSAEEMNHPSYPPGLPLLNAWNYVALGGVNERLAKIWMPLWWLSLSGLIWYEARCLAGVWWAIGFTFLVVASPIFLDHATLGNADLPFTTALTVAALALTRWIVAGDRRELAGGVLALGVASWLKLDGIYLGLALITCAALARWRHLYFHGGSRRQLAAQTFVAAIVLLGVYGPWLWMTHSAGLGAETPGLAMLTVTGLENLGHGMRVVISELLFSHNNSTWSPRGASYLLLWPICATIVFVRGWRARRNAPFIFLAAAVVIILLFYTLIYVLRPFFSIERYVMHAAPLAALAAIHVLGDSSVARDSV